MRKFLALILLAVVSNFSFALTSFFIYKDLAVFESEVTNEKILIPLSAYDIKVFPESILIIDENETNYCVDKELNVKYISTSNEIVSLNNKISSILNELSIYSNKMNIFLEISKSAQTPKDINFILSNIEAIQREMISMKTKLEEISKDLQTKLKEFERLEQKVKDKTFYFKELTFSGRPQKISYKIYANWLLKYSINANENSVNLNVKVNLPRGTLIKVNDITITTLEYTPEIVNPNLPKIIAYLREKEKFTLYPKVLKSYAKTKIEEEEEIYEGKEELPQPKEIPSYNITWNIKGNFIITNSQDLELSKLNISVSRKFFAIPSKYKSGILVIEISNTSPITLLPGEIELNIDNKTTKGLFLGETLPQNGIFRTEGIPIQEIIVKKETLQDRTENPGLFGGNIKNIKTFKNKVKNSTSKEVTIQILERIPIPSDNRININITSITPKPDQEINSIKTNSVFSWTANLKPGEEKEFTYSYTIEYPKDLIYHEKEE
jgi:hypothetical protein